MGGKGAARNNSAWGAMSQMDLVIVEKKGWSGGFISSPKILPYLNRFTDFLDLACLFPPPPQVKALLWNFVAIL